MEFGVCMAAKIDDLDYVDLMEDLGYSHLWVADSQMIWSDCYTVLALAAQQTRRIQLGTGVSVAGTRIAPVTANSIATINRLAPGRTFLGIGTGNTAMRLMGQAPLRLGEFRDYLRVLRALLRGEEVAHAWRGHSAPIAFQMQELGFLGLDPPVPIHVSAFGPKTQALAGEFGDGLVLSIPPEPGFMLRALDHARRGAERAGRSLESLYTTSLTAVAVLEPGERVDSPRVVEACGAFAIASLHYAYDRVRQLGGKPPAHLRGCWDDYCKLVEAVPETHRHLRVHAGHCTYLLEDEARFVTAELIRATCLVGTPDELVEQVQRLEAAGLRQIMILPSLATQYRVIEDFARRVMQRLPSAAA